MDSTLLRTTLNDPKLERFVGQWRRLVSTTNWEKGKIISEWRAAAVERGAPVSEYSDETWSRLVGGISPQHVGRLRRVHDRFGTVHATFGGLFWSHFQAALEWEDAEMWLEGAVQNRWSVSQMRHQRWETLGGDEPSALDVVDAEMDEDLDVANSAVPDDILPDTSATVREPDGSLTPAADASTHRLSAPDGEQKAKTIEPVSPQEAESPSAETARPFADLASLPDDLSEAIETLKVVILKHKLAKWNDVAPDDVWRHLEALKQLVVSP